MAQARHVLITGSSTGIGRACAVQLASRGWTVFAGVRKAADGEAVRAEAHGAPTQIVPVIIDVADAASIGAAVAQVGAAVGDGGLAGLVNNAGISVAGPVELVRLEEWRRQFEVNFFGHIAVTQAVLPLLRAFAADRPGPMPARVVMMSSIAGRFAQPILGPYCSSKFALEAMSDVLRRELRAQRIGVSVIEPGAIQSEIWRKALDEAAAQDASDSAVRPYDYLINGVTLAARQAADVAIPAVKVARVVEQCLTRRRPRVRALVGTDAMLMAAAKAILPTRWMDGLLEAGLRKLAKKSKGSG
jgi:NAD(P)-dependent dehydrogenase (short-subunit alcohol dehydrogenase family)